MSELDDAMEQHIAYIVIHESRPFCYRDFFRWDDGQKEWGMQHNTFRNKISKLRKAGKAKFCYYSSCAFYTLEDYPFQKPVTPYPYSGLPFPLSIFSSHYLNNLNNNDPLYKTIANLPFGAESIHDIRLRFTAPNIYKTFSCLLFPPNNFYYNTTSGDIAIPSFFKDNAIVRIVIHKTDVVSIIIGCSKQPIPLDAMGLIRFSCLLTRAEERLQIILDNYYHNQRKQNYFDSAGISAGAVTTTAAVPTPAVIPEYQSWLITMWHFGRDALTLYKGEKFCRTIEDAQHILTQIYSKEYGSGRGRRTKTKMRIRAETQEYPNTTVEEAIDELKLVEDEKLETS